MTSPSEIANIWIVVLALVSSGLWLTVSAVIYHYGKPYRGEPGNVTWEVCLLWPIILPLAYWHSK
jgi:hypothetical protein